MKEIYKNMFNKVFDYLDTDVLYDEGDPLTNDFRSYRNCSFEVEYPEINKFRVMKVDIPNKVIWMRQAKGIAPDDDFHMKGVVPKTDKNMIQTLYELDDDEIDENGNPVMFSIPFTKIRLRFYTENFSKKDSFVYEEGF